MNNKNPMAIYEKRGAAFAHHKVVTIHKKGELIGTICAHYPKDGAGRLTVFLHEYGYQITRGTASGYGYDKLTAAALCEAGKKGLKQENCENSAIYSFFAECSDSGTWQRDLQYAGFVVYCIV